MFYFVKNYYKMAETVIQPQIDNRDLIIKHLKDDDRDLMWLHKKTNIPYGTLYSIFTQRLFKVNKTNLKKINKCLGTEFKEMK